MDNRRDFLKKAALLASASGIAAALPDSIANALSINAAEGSTYMDAEHVVILMQENRSFDHTFGTLRGVRGYNDPRTITLPDKNPVWLQTNAKGETYGPFRLDIKNTKATWMHSLPHSWSNQVNARNDGKYDKWLDEKHSGYPEYKNMPLTMGYHTREDIPFYYAFADAFTICDQYFCSSLTGTNPNRLYFWTGTIRSEQNENSRALVWNDDMDYGTLNWPTFPERLEDHGISWKCYQNEMSIDVGFKGEEDPWLSNFQDNPLEFFAQYNIHLHQKHIAQLQKQQAEFNAIISQTEKDLAAASGSMADTLKNKLHAHRQELGKVNERLEKVKGKTFDQLSEREKNLHRKAFVTNTNDPHYHELTDLSYDDNGQKRTMKVPKGDVLHQFRQDVKNGALPTVSWVTAPENFSDHPSAPWYGAWYVSEVLDILTQNPEVWKKTILIVTYDENDGYFDHVPPFTPPHSHKPGMGKVSAGIDTRVDYVTLQQEQDRHDFPTKYDRECAIGLGYRVPMIIASPWTKGGFVNSEVFDHTSTLQFLERFLSQKTGKKITEPNISDWRRTVCGDLTSVFKPQGGQQSGYPKPVAKNDFLASIHKAKFKNSPTDFKLFSEAELVKIRDNPHATDYRPQQEKGTRPSCALPYELYADGALTPDKQAFRLDLSVGKELFGKASAGSPFNIYAVNRYQSFGNPAVFEDSRNWSYAVKPGDMLSEQWQLAAFENKAYHLRLYGPNGFYREFTGAANDPGVHTTIHYERNKLNNKVATGNLLVTIHNTDSRPHQVALTDNSYKNIAQHVQVLPKQSVTLLVDTRKSHQWYDFSIKVTGAHLFEKRYAGRVETGKHTQSDPLMGGTFA
ncbi:phospholipase C, phosphocholine-specific [Mucilaginibacter sp. RS28]|uniref:phospholipase C n=1 Tax=Mucilaginibacter straminoryzae TaxID=2932774 RepID=A0A9X2B7I7_9SPHI|nr:phospholipase C, phosphocholine-specific [Mucilaginibacter straminoryzae]MCJ8208589.1 phospholipase C, phosphocholine-specific [Mucilaginibacter straminoryzae]